MGAILVRQTLYDNCAREKRAVSYNLINLIDSLQREVLCGRRIPSSSTGEETRRRRRRCHRMFIARIIAFQLGYISSCIG